MSLDNDPFQHIGPQPPEDPFGRNMDDEQRRRASERRERFERQGGIPINAPDVLQDLEDAEIGENGDVTELIEATDQALAVMEGLEFGYTGNIYEFDPNNPHDIHKIAYLQNMFTTTESATDRPETTNYIKIALEENIAGRVRRVNRYERQHNKILNNVRRDFERENRILTQTGRQELPPAELEERLNEVREKYGREQAAIPALMELSNYVHANEVFDTAFIHRMFVCEDAGSSADLGIKTRTVTPDAAHWVGYWQSETPELHERQENIDTVFEEIIKFGLDDRVIQRLEMTPIPPDVRRMVGSDIYAQGFRSATIFGHWFKHLYEVSGQRADIVWEAWKLALTTEVIDSSLGEVIDSQGKYVLASPPLGNSLFTYIAHLPEKRAIEYGLKSNGERFQNEKFISHSGLPMSKDNFPRLCRDYLHESKVEFDARGLYALYGVDEIGSMIDLLPQPGDPDYEDSYSVLAKQILDCWNQERDPNGALVQEKVKISLWDLKLYGKLKFSDTRFPWFMTEQRDPTAAPGELSPGSFGGWFLTRSRSNDIVKDIRTIYSLQDLGSPTFFTDRLRNWSKVLGGLKNYDPAKPETHPSQNPRAWWLMGQIQFHRAETGTNAPVVVEDRDKDYRTVVDSQEISVRKEGREPNSSLGDIYRHAMMCGFLRQADVDWINEQLAIRLS